MRVRHLALLAACALPLSAWGDVVFDVVPVDLTVPLGTDPAVPDFSNAKYSTFDLIATPDQGDGWVSAYVEATLSGPVEFFQHPQGGNFPADPNLVAQYPALEFDCFFDAPSGHPLFAPAPPPGWPRNDPQLIEAEWYEAGDQVLDGATHTIARFTVRRSSGAYASLSVHGRASILSMGGVYPFGTFERVIPLGRVDEGALESTWCTTPMATPTPEPTGLALLGLGALVLARRR
jgi:MYXO-CTERM domain-containing protein